METLLQVNNLTAERDGRVLFSELSFTASQGQLIQITGGNGVGKTTLLRMLCQLYPATAGDIHWRGQPIQNQHYEFSQDLLFLGHQPGLKLMLSPRENLAAYFALRQVVSIQDIDAALAKVGLHGYEDVAVRQLSAGQQRRVALARLLVSNASLWLLDEPFTAIDKQGVAELETIVAEFVAQGGCVMLTSHQELSAASEVTKIALGVEHG